MCRKKAAEARKKREKEMRLQEQRDRDAAEHAQRIAALDAELEAKRQEAMDAQLSEDRANAIRQKEKDLASASSLPIRPKSSAYVQNSSEPAEPSIEHKDDKVNLPKKTNDQGAGHLNEKTEPRIDHVEFKSAARDDWEYQKRVDSASNEAIDEIMDLVGLEDVKSQVLRIKAKIDTSKRQHSDVKKERFSAAFLGNPGTGEYSSSITGIVYC